MQNPPPSGPHGPTPSQPATTSAGMDKKTAATLAYLVTWITGIIFLFVGKSDPDVKFHAARSLVTFLPLQIIWYLAGLLPSFVGFILNVVFFIAYIGLWIFCLYRAWTGNGQRFEIPFLSGVVDNLAEQVAARV
jgi:uncharacterized membrane protein